LKKLSKFVLTHLLVLFSWPILSEPWSNIDDEWLRLEVEQMRLCGISIPPISSYPTNLSVLKKILINADNTNLSANCLDQVNIIHKVIDRQLYTSISRVGLQTKRPDIYFQNLSKRQTEKPHLYFSNTSANDTFVYNISMQIFDNETRFDESYFAYYFNNHVLKIGRTSRWWSPSSDSSLILSNSARPSPGISFTNYNPKIIQSKYFSFLGPINYEFFINKLEEDRYVPNALLFGNRISIQPHSRLRVSFFRTAQFGGDGRNLNTKIFVDMLLGKDNYDADDLNKENEPGNQIGGMDFNLLLLQKKNLSLYGQIAGEDESGYLPSKTFYSLGLGYSWDQLDIKKINVEFSDTGSRQKNTTYNHSIFKNGYRYYGLPIGSAYDADSKIVSINFHQLLKNDLYINFRATKASLNYSNNSNFFIESISDDATILEINIKQRLTKNIEFKLMLHHIDFIGTSIYDNLNANASLEYRW
jgi:hypothetical protein